MQPRDPAQYRHFGVRGVLLSNGRPIDIFESCHADDLPDGAAGKDVIAERVRQTFAAELGDLDTQWQTVEVTEFRTPDAMYEVPKGTL